ncbi:MAG: hypothetical protein OK436_05910 [Thaumarchaeota archaeon]|nr:hypothetical protein [Nitrososphaerota archaeon]
MPDEFDDWETGTGLIEHFTGQVMNARFAPDANGRYKLILEFATDHPDAVGNTIEQHYSVGDKWASFDGGDSISFPGNPSRKINANSAYGKLIDKASELVGESIRSWGGTRRADTWVGSIWEMLVEHGSFKNPAGETINFSRNYPVKFLGMAKSAAGNPIGKFADLGGVVSDNPNPQGTVRDQAINLARSCTTHEEWINACFSLQGFVDDDILVKEVADPDALWATLKG